MRAISSMATRHVLTELLTVAVAAGLPPVRLESVGGVDAAARVTGGEAFDLVFLAADALVRLADAGAVDSGTVTPLLMSQVAVAVPDRGAPPAQAPDGPAFADAAALRAALRSATRIGYSTGPSGVALVRMTDEWEMTKEVGDRLAQARAGIPVARSLASGVVDLGFQQLSELVGQPGIRILGVMPPDCAIDTVFAGAVGASSSDPSRAAQVLSFFASESAAPIKMRHAFAAPPA